MLQVQATGIEEEEMPSENWSGSVFIKTTENCSITTLLKHVLFLVYE
jgi:hypothetical protein